MPRPTPDPAPNLDGAFPEVADRARPFARMLSRYHRHEVVGLDHVPKDSAALLVLNHSLQFGESLAESGRADAALAVWGPLGVFAVLCIWLFHGSLAWPGDNPISRASNRLGEGLQRLRRRLPGARK